MESRLRELGYERVRLEVLEPVENLEDTFRLNDQIAIKADPLNSVLE